MTSSGSVTCKGVLVCCKEVKLVGVVGTETTDGVTVDDIGLDEVVLILTG